MNSVDVLLALCQQRKIAVSRVERDLKYGNGYFKSLKKKEIPGNRLSEVADYFGVTMDYLLGATPESYLLGTEYQLNEAEKAYEKETNPDKRDELGGLIDLLRDSVADQRILLSATKKPVADTGNGLVNEDVLARQEAIKIISSYDSESLAQALSYLSLISEKRKGLVSTSPFLFCFFLPNPQRAYSQLWVYSPFLEEDCLAGAAQGLNTFIAQDSQASLVLGFVKSAANAAAASAALTLVADTSVFSAQTVLHG